MIKLVWIAFTGTLAGCAGADEAPDLGLDEADIQSGTDVANGDRVLDTTVIVETPSYACTGVVIAARYVLTASHCQPRAGGTIVKFYDGVGVSPGDARGVVEVWERPGVDDRSDWYDNNGNYADFAVLRLDAAIPSYAKFAQLAWFQQPTGDTVRAVGAGHHDGNDNPSFRLRYRDNTIRYYQSGTLNTQNEIVNGGDSGGPVYTDWTGNQLPIVHGVLWGSYYDIGGAGYRDRYTSTVFHASTMLDMMGRQSFSNMDVTGGTAPYRNESELSELQCAIDCMQSTRCLAYSYSYGTLACGFHDDLSGHLAVAAHMEYGRKPQSATTCTPDALGACRK